MSEAKEIAAAQKIRRKKWWQSFTAVIALVAPLTAVAIASWDAGVVAWFAQLNLPGDIEKSLHLSEAFAHGSGVIAIFAALLLVDVPKRRQILSAICMVVVIMIVANVSKSFISRSRPYTFEDVTAITGTWFPEITREGWDTRIRSFPSGHSATAAAMAFALTGLYPRGRFLFITIAALACLQRIASRSHYPTDVLAGVTIAAIIALMWQWWFPFSQMPGKVAEESRSMDHEPRQ